MINTAEEFFHRVIEHVKSSTSHDFFPSPCADAVEGIIDALIESGATGYVFWWEHVFQIARANCFGDSICSPAALFISDSRLRPFSSVLYNLTIDFMYYTLFQTCDPTAEAFVDYLRTFKKIDLNQWLVVTDGVVVSTPTLERMLRDTVEIDSDWLVNILAEPVSDLT
jgi:hypothetical protein